MNSHTPERGKNEDFDVYKIRRQVSKLRAQYLMKRGPFRGLNEKGCKAVMTKKMNALGFN